MDYLYGSINTLLLSLIFPNSLKVADVTRIPKKGMKELKEDYRSVSIFSSLSKMFERIMFIQISASFAMFSQNITVDFGKAIVLNIAI